jgi:hypothetical protein
MMKTMKKTLLASFACATLASTALAGYTSYSPVAISGNFASGGLGDARASASRNEHIGCNTFGWSDSTHGHAFCWARSAASEQKVCVSTNPSIVQAASAVGTASYLNFLVDEKTGQCLQLDVQNDSSSRPMVP